MVIQPQRRVAARSAFTLLEVLIVVAILVVLAGVSSVYVFRYLEESRINRCKADIKTLERAAMAYEIQYGTRPTTLQELVTPPSGKPFVLEEALVGPLGPYQYDAQGTHNQGLKHDVWFMTASGEQIGNWQGSGVGH
jgi:prepilin-type N-terminal cleavage/methylation domain-containing protein